MRINGFSLLLAGLLLLIPPMAFKASASCAGLDLEDAGNGSYRVVARGLVNIGAIDLTLTYDKAALSKPSVKRGELVSNWMIFMPYIVETAGTVRIAMVNEPPVSGSGTVAIVTFTPTGKSWGRPVLTCALTGLDASNQQTGSSSSTGTGQESNTAPDTGSVNNDNVLPDSGSTQTSTGPQSDSDISVPSETVTTVETPVTVETPATAETPANVEVAQQSSSSTVSAVSSAPYIAAGAINLGVDVQQQQLELETSPEQESELDDDSTMLEEPSDAVEQNVQDHSAEAPALPIPPVAGPAQNKKYVVYPGVLERFKEYGGERSPKALIALFKQPVMPSIKQNPSVFIADGTTVLEVLVELPERGSQAPNFALRGASLQSLRKQGDNTWMIKAVPESGRVDAVLTVVNGENIVDYPFTIAPRVDVNLDKKGVVDEADFALFLATAEPGKTPTFDLNGDGRRDYVDDFIFTANYLAVAGAEGARK